MSRIKRNRQYSKPRPSTASGKITSMHTLLNSISAETKESLISAKREYTMATGRVAGTELLRDRFMTSRPQVIELSCSPLFEPVAKTNWFADIGQVAQYDATTNTLMGSLMRDTYGGIVRLLAKHRGRMFAIRDTTLLNTGNFNSFPLWLTLYSEAYMTARCAQSILDSGGLNYTLQLMAAAVNANLPALLEVFQRLASYSVPPKFLEMLDANCGVKCSAVDEPIYVVLAFGDIGRIDLTLAASWATILGNCLTAINLLTVGSADLIAADAQAISNVLAYAYGDVAWPLMKGYSTDEAEYCNQKFQAVSVNDTAGNIYGMPNINVAGATNIVPIVVPRGEQSASTKYLFSLLRTSVYSTDLIAGEARTAQGNLVGLFGNERTTAQPFSTQWGRYPQSGVFTLQSESFAGAHLSNEGDPEFSVLPWSSPAANHDADYTVYTQSWSGYDIVWLLKDWLLDETVYMWQEMWLDPLRTPIGV